VDGEFTFGIGIDPYKIYTREELRERLSGTIALETLLQGLGVQPIFRQIILGAEIVGAMERVRSHRPEAGPMKLLSRNARSSKPGRVTSTKYTMHPLKNTARPVDPLKPLTAEDLV